MISDGVVMVEPELESKALSIPEQAERIEIRDQATYDAAARYLLDVITPMIGEVHGAYDSIVRKNYEAWQESCAKRRSYLEPIERAETAIKQRIVAYEVEQRRIQEERERVALAAAEQQVDESTEAAIMQAEAGGAPEDEIRLIINQPMALAKPFVPQTHQRAADLIRRRTYKGGVRNLRELLTAVLNGMNGKTPHAPQHLIQVNQTGLNILARQYGPELSRFVPGTVAIEDNSISTRRGSK